MVKESGEKVIVHILYPCFVCANEYPTAAQVIHHVKNIHGYILHPRPTGHHRPQDKHYDFENDIRNKWDVQHYGCPSCWYHAPKNMESVMEHVMREHEPEQAEGFVHQHEEDEDELLDESSDQEKEKISSSEKVEARSQVSSDGTTEEEKSDTEVVVEDDSHGEEQDLDKDDKNEPSDRSTENNAVLDNASNLFQSEKELFLQETYLKFMELSESFKKLFKNSRY